MNASNKNMPGALLDPADDAPELGEEFFDRADLYEGERLVRRGRPPVAVPRPMLSMRVDADLLEKLRASGRGWQTRVHAALKEAVDSGRL